MDLSSKKSENTVLFAKNKRYQSRHWDPVRSIELVKLCRLVVLKASGMEKTLGFERSENYGILEPRICVKIPGEYRENIRNNPGFVLFYLESWLVARCARGKLGFFLISPVLVQPLS